MFISYIKKDFTFTSQSRPPIKKHLISGHFPLSFCRPPPIFSYYMQSIFPYITPLVYPVSVPLMMKMKIILPSLVMMASSSTALK